MLSRFANKRVLLLQGPLGPFFKRFAKDLERNGATVTKVNFCGGDNFFFKGKNVIKYRDTLYNWPCSLKKIIQERKITTIALLGDCRPYHIRAKSVAADMGIEFYSFEEGYLRPNFVTLEKDGVNGHSLMSKNPEFYISQNMTAKQDIRPVGRSFWIGTLYTTLYYVSTALSRWRYPHYVHHRTTSVFHHAMCWVRGYFRKLYFAATEKKYMKELTTKWSHRYFLFPLQVHNDYQFHHAKYEKIEDCIEEVFHSFSTDAPRDNMLVVKHHPADRPYRDYTKLIRYLSARYQMQDRVLYVHDLHLPTLLQHARGTVLMNSTVGISSIHHQTSVKVLGSSIYNIPGLTHQGTMKEFWTNPGEPDMILYNHFRGWMEHNNQFNGNFYKRLTNTQNATGVIWHR
ncbi:MAG: capsular biosynthesis protein [Deltaproteobacteria bacterium]|nr:capsular biosynthesis protein [Deltaproteobacteria bacterium]